MKRVHYGIYDDEEILLSAVKQLKSKNWNINTPAYLQPLLYMV